MFSKSYCITLRPHSLRHTQATCERAEAGQQLLAHLVPQQLVRLVVRQVGVEQRDEDHGHDPLKVPQHVLTTHGGDHACDDFSLERFFTKCLLRCKPGQVQY